MAYHPLTDAVEMSWEDQWAFMCVGTSAGGDNGFALDVSELPNIRGTDRDVIFDGMGVWYVGAAKLVLPFISSMYPTATSYVEHPLQCFTTTLNGSTHSFLSLNIPSRLANATQLLRFHVMGGTGALDAVYVSAWGHFRPQKAETPEPIAVDVKSVRFFPPRPRVGEI